MTLIITIIRSRIAHYRGKQNNFFSTFISHVDATNDRLQSIQQEEEEEKMCQYVAEKEKRVSE